MSADPEMVPGFDLSGVTGDYAEKLNGRYLNGEVYHRMYSQSRSADLLAYNKIGGKIWCYFTRGQRWVFNEYDDSTQGTRPLEGYCLTEDANLTSPKAKFFVSTKDRYLVQPDVKIQVIDFEKELEADNILNRWSGGDPEKKEAYRQQMHAIAQKAEVSDADVILVAETLRAKHSSVLGSPPLSDDSILKKTLEDLDILNAILYRNLPMADYTPEAGAAAPGTLSLDESAAILEGGMDTADEASPTKPKDTVVHGFDDFLTMLGPNVPSAEEFPDLMKL